MGSYITIVNNTSDTFSVKVGPDEQALAISKIVGGAIATVLTAGLAANALIG